MIPERTSGSPCKVSHTAGLSQDPLSSYVAIYDNWNYVDNYVVSYVVGSLYNVVKQ